MRQDRSVILSRCREVIARGEAIIGGGAGSGLSAHCQELAGVDLIVIYNSGRFRMAGRGSLAGLLALGNANEIVLEMACDVLPMVERTPVLAGVNGTDPFMIMSVMLDTVSRLGFSGVQNFPTVGLYDGRFRADLERTGFGYAKEVELIRAAHEMDFFTTPYVFSAEDAAAMTQAGADILVCHLGLTVGGLVGTSSLQTLDACVGEIDSWSAAARQIREDILILCHGGPIANPSDVQYILDHSRYCQGFYGASSMERLPVEHAIQDRVAEFKTLRADHTA